MLEIINKHLAAVPQGCVVEQWVRSLSEEEQTGFDSVKASTKVVVADLYLDLMSTIELPFKLTAFRSHMRGYCTCPKN